MTRIFTTRYQATTEVVFWDTVVYVALANRDDSLHAQAVQGAKRVLFALSVL